MNDTIVTATETNNEEWVPLPEAARMLQLNYGTQIQRCRRGAFPSKKVTVGSKNHYLVRISDLKKIQEVPVSPCAKKAIEPSKENSDVDRSMDLVDAPGESNPPSDKSAAGKRGYDSKRSIDYVKNLMRKFPAPDLLKVGIWINGRLYQKCRSGSPANQNAS